ncbi:hypothetical protein LXL04_015766 [Taraxacum kok-saghyz]
MVYLSYKAPLVAQGYKDVKDIFGINKESGSFENSYLPENSQTVNFFETDFEGLKIAQIQVRSLHNTYLKGFVKIFLKRNAKKNCTYTKKSCKYAKIKKNIGPEVGFLKGITSRSFENSYIPENPRTPKPLTFSKNRLRGAKNRSNISPVAKIFFRKNDFFFPKTLHMCKLFFCAYVHSFLSLYNTYLKRFVKKNLKKNAKKKSCTYAQKIKKKVAHMQKLKKNIRIVMIKNVLEGSEVGFLKGITIRGNQISEYLAPEPSLYLFVITDPTACITDSEVKFSEGKIEEWKFKLPSIA